jgi:putative tricarboxylic transport membrane protein
MRVRSFLLAAVLTSAPFGAAAQEPFEVLRIIAPAAPGGGWDQTARVMQLALTREGIARSAPVENIAGAAGTIGLARFISAERAAPDVVMVSGLIMLGAIVTHQSPVTLHEVTPIARLVGEYEAVVVPAGSPYGTLDDLLRAFRASPESISWGGGSAGGTDQILAGLIADAVGVPPRRVNYIAFSGGGEALAAIVGGQVSVGINGLAEFEGQIAARTVRVLAISSAKRLDGVDAPTLVEQGVNVELENWRSVVAAPGIRPAERHRLEAAVDRMVRTPAWRAALERYRWIDRYMAGDEFERFVASEERRVGSILRRLGTGRTEDAARRSTGTYPLLVLAGLMVSAGAVLVETMRARRARPAAAESRPRPRLRPVLLVGGGIVLNLLLLQPAGFVIAATVLFWFTARAFDPRRPLRDLVFASAVSAGCYLLFVRALKLTLPAGVFGGTW